MSLESRIDNPVRTIGALEFECCVPQIGHGTSLDIQRQIAGILSANGIRATYRGYSRDPVPPESDIVVETDSSVRGESRLAGVTWVSLEVKTRILQGLADYERLVPETLEILRTLNGKVNASTGFHLHIGFHEVHADARVIRSLYNLIHRFEPVLFSLVSPSRRSNSFCRPLPDVSKLLHGCRKLSCFEEALGRFERYQAMNWTHLFDDDGRFRESRISLPPGNFGRHESASLGQVLRPAPQPRRYSILPGEPGTSAANKGWTAQDVDHDRIPGQHQGVQQSRTGTSPNWPLLLASPLERAQRPHCQSPLFSLTRKRGMSHVRNHRNDRPDKGGSLGRDVPDPVSPSPRCGDPRSGCHWVCGANFFSRRARAGQDDCC